MTINELINHLNKAKDTVGGDSEIKFWNAHDLIDYDPTEALSIDDISLRVIHSLMTGEEVSVVTVRLS